MNNFDTIKTMTLEQLALYLYVNLSKKGFTKTKEWLLQEVMEAEDE